MMKQLSIYRNDDMEIILERTNEFGTSFKKYFDSEKGLLEALNVYISTGEIDDYEVTAEKEFFALVIKHLEKVEMEEKINPSEVTLKNLFDAIRTKRKVVCITGGLAEGKTLAMSVLVNELQKELDASSFSNYGLANAYPIGFRKAKKEWRTPEQYEIISVDEGHSVFQFSRNFMDDLLSEQQEDRNLVVIFNSTFMDRIPRESRKKIDIHLKVKRDGENGEIKVSGVNVPYERTLLIEESIGYYNAFESAEYRL